MASWFSESLQVDSTLNWHCALMVFGTTKTFLCTNAKVISWFIAWKKQCPLLAYNYHSTPFEQEVWVIHWSLIHFYYAFWWLYYIGQVLMGDLLVLCGCLGCLKVFLQWWICINVWMYRWAQLKWTCACNFPRLKSGKEQKSKTTKKRTAEKGYILFSEAL